MDSSSSDEEELWKAATRLQSSPLAQHLRTVTIPRDELERGPPKRKSNVGCGALECSNSHGKWVKVRLAVLGMVVICIVAAVVIGTRFWPKGFTVRVQNVRMGAGNYTDDAPSSTVAVYDRTMAAHALDESLRLVKMDLSFHNPSIFPQHITQAKVNFVAVPQQLALATKELPAVPLQKRGQGYGVGISLAPKPSAVQAFLAKYLNPVEPGYYRDDSSDFHLNLQVKSEALFGSLHLSHSKLHVCGISVQVIDNYLRPSARPHSC